MLSLVRLYWDVVLFWDEVKRGVYLREPFFTALFFFALCPFYWNASGRVEYHYKLISRLFGGNKKLACSINAVAIFSVGLLRDYFYNRALDDCHISYALRSPFIIKLGYVILSLGGALTAAAYYQLGILGVYSADHFGILLDKKVEGFPYNLTEHPLYEGATMIFLGWGLVNQKISGVVLSFCAYVIYMTVAKLVEEPFTNHIYSTAAKQKKN